jgi:DNA gyrase subunit A
LIAINLEEGDKLGWVLMTEGGQDMIVVTEQGRGLRFNEEDARPMGRAARGVNAIKLEPGDRVTSACVVDPAADLLIITNRAYGKRTALREFSTQRRYGKGVIAISGHPKKRGIVAAARPVYPEDEVIMISMGGMVLRTRVKDIPQMRRPARGATVMDLKPGDELTSVAVLEAERDEADVEEPDEA